jgi:Arc/MetJ-type ribon-helix-helix transcriptional regulator
MMTRGAAIERAFELARSGQYRSVSEIIRRLPPEDRQSVEAHLAKPNARRELILVCSEAWLATQ